MSDLASYYIERKHKINILKKKDHSSMYNRVVDILSAESEEFLRYELEYQYKSYNIHNESADDSTYEERMIKWVEELEGED